jgi:glycosyltransferase involved in cell wall biosynthesis
MQSVSPVLVRAQESVPVEASEEDRALKVSVLVDLLWRENAGGHVKCWERLAEAAARSRSDVDLTVHFQGEQDGCVELAPHVRYLLHRPVFSSARLPFLSHVPDHSDLAPWQPHLADSLNSCRVIHTTDAYFAFAATAERLAMRRRLSLVHSVHTDTPSYTRVFTAQTIERLVGKGVFGHLLNDQLRLPERGERSMLRRLARHQGRCSFVLASRPLDRERALTVLPPERVRSLRRGIDHVRFNPARGDRAMLAQWLGVPCDAQLVAYAGRIDRGKNVLVLAEAVRQLIAEGAKVHLICVGEGTDRGRIGEMLGPAATCPGSLAQDDVAKVFASADIFAFPSLIEIHSNVIQEALCSGLPAVVAKIGGTRQLVRGGRTGLLVSDSDPRTWAEALRPLVGNPALAVAMGRAARVYAERHLPSWDRVLAEDLLPVWTEAAGELAESASGRACWRHAS